MSDRGILDLLLRMTALRPQKYFLKIRNFAFHGTQISNISTAVPPRMRGVSRSSRTLGRDAVDAGCAFDERAARGRRSCVVLTPRRWRQVCGSHFRRRRWQESPVTGTQEREGNR